MRAALVAVAVALAAAPAATATIVPQRGKADVRLGMTQECVRAVLGEPLRTVHGRSDFGCYVGSFTAGTRVTDFQIRSGRVVRVTVGFVID